jgi:hypothetical protein
VIVVTAVLDSAQYLRLKSHNVSETGHASFFRWSGFRGELIQVFMFVMVLALEDGIRPDFQSRL